MSRVGSDDFLVRIYVSNDSPETTKAWVGASIGRGPDMVAGSFRSWLVPEGEVQLLDKPTPTEDSWPEKAKCVLVTYAPAPSGPLQRFAALLGIKP